MTDTTDRELLERFKIGDVVKLKRGTVKLSPPDVKNYRTATIRAFLTDVEGGVLLDRHMGGFRYWNVLDLEHAASLAKEQS